VLEGSTQAEELHVATLKTSADVNFFFFSKLDMQDETQHTTIPAWMDDF
jgi:hypothetical protein